MKCNESLFKIKDSFPFVFRAVQRMKSNQWD